MHCYVAVKSIHIVELRVTKILLPKTDKDHPSSSRDLQRIFKFTNLIFHKLNKNFGMGNGKNSSIDQQNIFCGLSNYFFFQSLMYKTNHFFLSL